MASTATRHLRDNVEADSTEGKAEDFILFSGDETPDSEPVSNRHKIKKRDPMSPEEQQEAMKQIKSVLKKFSSSTPPKETKVPKASQKKRGRPSKDGEKSVTTRKKHKKDKSLCLTPGTMSALTNLHTLGCPTEDKLRTVFNHAAEVLDTQSENSDAVKELLKMEQDMLEKLEQHKTCVEKLTQWLIRHGVIPFGGVEVVAEGLVAQEYSGRGFLR